MALTWASMHHSTIQAQKGIEEKAEDCKRMKACVTHDEIYRILRCGNLPQCLTNGADSPHEKEIETSQKMCGLHKDGPAERNTVLV
jgi:hypothetical protein